MTVYSDASFTSSDYPDYKYVKGENELNGSEALAFVRERYNLGRWEIMQEDVIRWLLYQQS